MRPLVTLGNIPYLYVMKNLTTLFALIVSCSMLGQTNPEFNPDFDGNGYIGIDDILGVLSYYDSPWPTPPAWSCGDPVSYQGYDYATVLIGSQCWFAENLRSEYYQNGDSITAGLNDSDWNSTTGGATSVYGEGGSTCYGDSPDGDACDEDWSVSEYGRLYNGYAVIDVRGLCPSGWHVPFYEEQVVLRDHLGGTYVAGEAMKSTYGWYDPWGVGNGTNSSGFSGLPGGLKDTNGQFSGAGNFGWWWSASNMDDGGLWVSKLTYDTDFNPAQIVQERFGLSIRCIQD